MSAEGVTAIAAMATSAARKASDAIVRICATAQEQVEIERKIKLREAEWRPNAIGKNEQDRKDWLEVALQSDEVMQELRDDLHRCKMVRANYEAELEEGKLLARIYANLILASACHE